MAVTFTLESPEFSTRIGEGRLSLPDDDAVERAASIHARRGGIPQIFVWNLRRLCNAPSDLIAKVYEVWREHSPAEFTPLEAPADRAIQFHLGSEQLVEASLARLCSHSLFFRERLIDLPEETTRVEIAEWRVSKGFLRQSVAWAESHDASQLTIQSDTEEELAFAQLEGLTEFEWLCSIGLMDDYVEDDKPLPLTLRHFYLAKGRSFTYFQDLSTSGVLSRCTRLRLDDELAREKKMTVAARSCTQLRSLEVTLELNAQPPEALYKLISNNRSLHTVEVKSDDDIPEREYVLDDRFIVAFTNLSNLRSLSVYYPIRFSLTPLTSSSPALTSLTLRPSLSGRLVGVEAQLGRALASWRDLRVVDINFLKSVADADLGLAEEFGPRLERCSLEMTEGVSPDGIRTLARSLTGVKFFKLGSYREDLRLEDAYFVDLLQSLPNVEEFTLFGRIAYEREALPEAIRQQIERPIAVTLIPVT